MKTHELKTFLGAKPIAVLFGGTSGEREISLRSGTNVHASLVRQGFNAHLLDARDDFIGALRENTPAVVLIMLHGTPGEDGSVQGAIETLGLPYTGSGVQASALGIHKVAAKRIFVQMDLNTPPFLQVSRETPLDDAREHALRELGLPMVVKPVNEAEAFLESTTNPHYGGSFQYGRPRAGHGWGRANADSEHRIQVMAQHITKNAPRGENTRQWRY